MKVYEREEAEKNKNAVNGERIEIQEDQGRAICIQMKDLKTEKFELNLQGNLMKKSMRIDPDNKQSIDISGIQVKQTGTGVPRYFVTRVHADTYEILHDNLDE